MRKVAVLLAFFFLLPGALQAEDLDIGRMRVALWPEYDSAGVLYIYDGRFKNNESFPNETVFIVPAGAVISDACSLSPKGQHFCQLYKQKKAGDFDEVSLKLPYPNFYLSFHTDPFSSIRPGGKRVLKHVIRANHRIDRLEVDVQSPLRAEGFRVIKPAAVEASEKKGYAHYESVFENVPKGTAIEVEIEYSRPDATPSVDIKYSPMSEPAVKAEAPYERQRSFVAYVYVAVGAGAIVLVVLIAALLRSRRGQ